MSIFKKKEKPGALSSASVHIIGDTNNLGSVPDCMKAEEEKTLTEDDLRKLFVTQGREGAFDDGETNCIIVSVNPQQFIDFTKNCSRFDSDGYVHFGGGYYAKINIKSHGALTVDGFEKH